MDSNKTHYLFCYFTGNEPENESVHFAISKNGFDFEPVNGGKKIIEQKLGKKCCRDPFIFRNESGGYYIIATDMKCREGWNSNNSMVVWESKDLINWHGERIIDFSKIKGSETADRIWAPEVLFDKIRGEYMIYWSHHNAGTEPTVIKYAYTKDFKSLSTEPRVLFAPSSGKDGIDADIIFNCGKYYLYYKDEHEKTICIAVSNEITGPYTEAEPRRACNTDIHLEGNCMYPLPGGKEYIMIADKYVDGGYYMQKTGDMLHFEPVPDGEFSLNALHPRHGSVLAISEKEYNALKAL